ncbi:NUC173-domain-containing protein [Nadsonia fulvescens var. elongata DSM 6958]|uniref:NUC173-domain-containing protein n=1 Tax=Nadsonia fulvescens var. elongata DSM 6958 TaxID=857566 RepID=A0A1E3PN62_9ASCO|nr:NUC173-domain-containing protein [Nadsonia fulvescens var. elongata DSM 6958]
MATELDTPLHVATLDERFDKIRIHQNSKIAQQKQLAIILAAVDENLESENTTKTATAYFVSFLALLEQSFTASDFTDKSLASSTVYFLDLVLPFTPVPLLRSKFEFIFSKLVLVLGHADADAPLIRPAVGALQTLLIAQDNSAWEAPSNQMSARKGMVGLLSLGLDPRPKVRKRAHDAVTEILKNPPPSPSKEHPAAGMCADAALKSVILVIENIKKANQAKKSNERDDRDPRIIHALYLVKAIIKANSWPVDKVEPLCETLLGISKTSDQFLIMAAFDVFESLFKCFTDVDVDGDKLIRILDAIGDLICSVNDQHLAPAWLAVIAQGIAAYSMLNPKDAFNRLPAVFNTVITFLESDSKNIHTSASQCLIALISTAIPDELLVECKAGSTTDKILIDLAITVTNLLAIKYQKSWNDILDVVSAFLDTLRFKAYDYLLEAVKIVGALRSDERFVEGRAEADKVLGSAIRAFGPERVLVLFPLNLENPGPQNPGRAWMLPLLRDNLQFAKLGHFISEFVPLSERLFQKVIESRGSEKTMQVKIYETLVDQIWSLLPRYCDLPFDLRDSLTQDFAEMLSNLLYKQVEIRPIVCQSLRLLVESNVAYAEGAVADDILMMHEFPISEAKKNVKFLANTFASKVLAVLFNVFAQTMPEARNFILEAINAYLSITPTEEVEATFNKVCALLHQAIQQEQAEAAEAVKAGGKVSKTASKDGIPVMSLTMMDLIVTITGFLPQSSHNTLLTIFVSTIKSDDPLLQKKAYRVLSKLSETEQGTETIKANMANIEGVLLEVAESVNASSRGARLSALSKIIELMSEEDLHFIPCILSEAVVATKDVNERTRESAYDLLVQMGHKMKLGGIIQNSKIAFLENPDAPATVASLDEYFTMISAGLAGATPHMISASITALSRVLFEFKNDMSAELLAELSSTVELFLTSNNREIVKSTLGFVKITAISLPIEVVKPNLKSFIQHLLVWSHEHKAHFKSKVKHIVERLIRRFGFEEIEKNFPEEDMKLLSNIRKTKERAKRQKESGETNEQESKKRVSKFANEYDEAIYGDSSDEESDSELADTQDRRKGSAKSKQYIVEQGDEPLDLLSRQALAHISSSKPRANQQKFVSNASKFKKNEDGKFVFSEKSKDSEDPLAAKSGSGIDAYLQAVRDGPVRGQRNKLKFKRGKKNEGDLDDESDHESKPASDKKSGKFGSKVLGGNKVSKPQHKKKFTSRGKL